MNIPKLHPKELRIGYSPRSGSIPWKGIFLFVVIIVVVILILRHGSREQKD